MQFTTVRSKGKRLLHLFKVRKTGSQQLEARKNVSQLFGSAKNWFLAISSLTNTVAAIWREKKVDPCYLETKKQQFTTVRSKEKDYDIYLKSEKLVHRQQEHEKNVSQLFGSGKNWFLAISSLTNTVAAIWREKKVDPCYLETKKCSSKLLEQQGKRLLFLFIVRKTGSQQLEPRKICFPAIWKCKKLVPIFRASQTLFQLFGERKTSIPAICRPKNSVHNCQEQGKRL